jgi:hypothetical protein
VFDSFRDFQVETRKCVIKTNQIEWKFFRQRLCSSES